MATRVAIIGTGGIAFAHMNAWDAAGDRVERVAAVDVDLDRAEAFARQHGIPRWYASASEMFASEQIDLVHICTPPALHFPLAMEAMAAGASVLCEKPLCGSLRQVDELIAAERRTGTHCMSVVQWRFGSAARTVRSMIDTGQFGRPTVTSCQTTWYRDAAYYAVPWRGTWASELGGVSVGHAIHIIDLMLSLSAPWREVTAITGTLVHDIEVEDAAMAMVRFADGSLGSVLNSVVSPRQETRLRMDFQRATVEVIGLYGYANANWTLTGLDVAADGDDALAGWPPAEDVPSSHAAQLGAVLDALTAGERPPADATAIRPTLEFLTALYASAASGRAVAAGQIGPGDPFYDSLSGHAVPAVAG
ncbi:MAG TPA: Gfo/Idh/MocA family oxidoreductase [Thermomicrobiales bacterium]|nr:Gfo/Idh/MocA family oxidoreductase [Thermomicrobiales bacterium]